MNLIDRYVHEVSRHLPSRQRDDVAAELRSSILDSLEDRHQGEPSEEDVIAMLEEVGRPQEVAASYRPVNSYLIGPELYATFRMVLIIVLGAVTLGLVITNVVRGIFADDGSLDLFQRLTSFLSQAWSAWFSAGGSVVLIFAILQRLDVHPESLETRWDPRSLPEVKKGDVAGRGEAIAGIAFGLIFFVLLNVFKDRVGLVTILGEKPLLNHIVRDNLIWLNIALIFGTVVHGVLLWQGRWTLPVRLAKLASDLLWVFIIYQMVTSFAAEKQVLVEAGLGETVPTILVNIGYFIVVASAIGFLANFGKWIAQIVTGSAVSYRLPGK